MFQEHTVRKIQLSLKKKERYRNCIRKFPPDLKHCICSLSYSLSHHSSSSISLFLSPDQRGCLECRKVISFASRLRLHDCRLKINLRHFLIQSEVKQNQLRRARTSFPALFGSYMLLLQRFDWFTGLSALFVIGLHVW